MIRLTCVVVLVLLGVFPAAGQERSYLAIDEQGGRHAFSFRAEADAVNGAEEGALMAALRKKDSTGPIMKTAERLAARIAPAQQGQQFSMMNRTGIVGDRIR